MLEVMKVSTFPPGNALWHLRVAFQEMNWNIFYRPHNMYWIEYLINDIQK